MSDAIRGKAVMAERIKAWNIVDSLGDDEAAEGIEAFFGKRPADFSALRRTSAVLSQ